MPQTDIMFHLIEDKSHNKSRVASIKVITNKNNYETDIWLRRLLATKIGNTGNASKIQIFLKSSQIRVWLTSMRGAACQSLNEVSIISSAAQDLHKSSDICIEFFVLAFVTLQTESSLQSGSWHFNM